MQQRRTKLLLLAFWVLVFGAFSPLAVVWGLALSLLLLHLVHINWR